MATKDDTTTNITSLDDAVALLAGIRAKLAQPAETPEQRFLAAFRDLSEAQQGFMVELVEDIVEGNVAPLHVATAESARIALASFEAEAANVSAGECHWDLH